MFTIFLVGVGGLALAAVVFMFGLTGTYLRVSDRFDHNMLVVCDYIVLVSVLVGFLGAVGTLIRG